MDCADRVGELDDSGRRLRINNIVYYKMTVDWKTVAASAAAALIVAYIVATLHNPPTDTFDGSYWACSNAVCSRYLTEQEWTEKNCFIQDDIETCIIRTPQGNYVVPKDRINITSMRECAQVTCTQEVLVKDAEYKIT